MNRHFKKYYFYFIARLLGLLGQYDDSLSFYSKVIQFRTFFWDVQKRYRFAYQHSSKKCYLELHGGVGDFLQFLPFILENKSGNYIVITHFLDAKNFFKFFGVNNLQYYFYNNREEHRFIIQRLRKNHFSYWCPRCLFFDQFPIKVTEKAPFKNFPIVGMHIGASGLTSQSLDIRFVLSLIDKLVQLKCKVVLFGTQAELYELKKRKYNHNQVFYASDKDIIKNLFLVKYCDFLIGTDSVFKTMSSMTKIPTLVFYKDDRSRFRDRVFINPYVKEGVMFVYKYKNISKEISPAIQFLEKIIRFKLFPSVL